MHLIIPILIALGFYFDGLGHFIDALSNAGFFSWLGSIEWSTLFHWSQAAPTMQMTPQPNFGNVALYDQFQHLMDTQFQIGELKRLMLTMPALPTEGF